MIKYKKICLLGEYEVMYAYIKGILEEKGMNYIVIEVSGIGYKIFMSNTAIESLDEIGTNIKVYTHYHVREDDISLFGFKTNEELRMFELLISVSGVGAKSALTILANIEPSSFALAVISNDTSKLVKLPGIGAKSAARIILELKDKIKTEEIAFNQNEKAQNSIVENEKISEAISALQVLGYHRKDIENVIKKLKIESMSLEEIIKNSLKYLSRS